MQFVGYYGMLYADMFYSVLVDSNILSLYIFLERERERVIQHHVISSHIILDSTARNISSCHGMPYRNMSC